MSGERPRICIYGAGAIGGYAGALLAEKDEAEVSLIARGEHGRAIRDEGLTLRIEDREIVRRVTCTDDPGELGPQDFVLLAMKAHAVPPVVEAIQPLLGPETTVVTAQNGIPWWYFHKQAGPLEGRRLETVDPGGTLWENIAPERCLGCVVYPAAHIAAPGVIEHTYGNRFMLGEPDGSRSDRAKRLSRLLNDAGMKAPVRPRIRDDIWLKLWGNLSFNPVSALTCATLADIAGDPGPRSVVRTMMVEAEAVATALGVKFPVDVDTRIGWAADVGDHKTSMLQDLEAGKRLELEALVTVVIEIAGLVNVPTPWIEAIASLVVQRARTAGCL